jgi:hypothetical protein
VENLWNEWVAATEKQITLGDDHKRARATPRATARANAKSRAIAQLSYELYKSSLAN